MLTNHRAIAGLLLASAALVSAVYTRLLWCFTVDDAYITFRYSQHLAAHCGLAYNLGDPPAEGCTSVLWMLLLTLSHPLRIDPVLLSKLLGLMATLAYACLAARWVYELTEALPHSARLVPAAFTVLCLAAFAPTAVHAVSGMETAPFTLLLVAFGYWAHRCAIRPTRSNTVCVAVAGLLLGLARPEGNLAAIIGMGVLAIIASQRAQVLRGALWLYGVPGALYFVWRWRYFGHLLPLPFYVKVGQEGLLNGLGDVLSFVYFLWLHVGILVLLGLLRLRMSVVPLLAACAALLIFFLVPEHIMGYDWRYLAPMAPVAFVLAAVGLSTLQSWLSLGLPPAGAQRWRASGGILGVCLLVPASFLLPARNSIRDRRRYALGMNSAYLPLAHCLEQAPHQPVPPVLAMGDAGACPYYSGWRNIDLFGLNEPCIALQDPHDLQHVMAQQYVMAQRPDVVILISRNPLAFVGRPFEASLYRRCLAVGMEPTHILQDNEHRYLWVMATRGTPVNRYLRRWRPPVQSRSGAGLPL
jgi:arabinofuranosyltransferase